MLNIIQKIQVYVILTVLKHEMNIWIAYTVIIHVILKNVKLELLLFFFFPSELSLFWCIFLDIRSPLPHPIRISKGNVFVSCEADGLELRFFFFSV